MEIISPYKVEKVVRTLTNKKYNYIRRVEFVDDSDYGGNGLEMINYYSLDTGHWIGGKNTAMHLCKEKNLRDIQKSKRTHCVASIGFNRRQKKWYGWSHRAICGFKVGDKIFEERFGSDKTRFTKHGKKTIKTLADAKLSAKRFAASVG